MRVVSPSYFGSGSRDELPNITTSTGEASDLTEFETFIDLKEVDYLEGFFGYELGKIIIEALDDFIDNATPLPSRISDIITGAEFTDMYGRLQKWKGLQRADLISPIADYVYYHWRRMKISDTTISGEMVNDPESSTDIGAGQKMCTNWNYGVDQNIILHDFMRANSATYPEFVFSVIGQQEKRNLLSKINLFGI